ncbi:hypothetical protein PR048_012933 [Dryococelus australis]|uniref:DUF5641 domain-containing protein n=1 Tax=Dryococelus australis TaxID=614101 RepID=A0ABQ9HQW7_9NEOP|nr:hypothetical protein PR048_012933 [Dryococelus australis]
MLVSLIVMLMKLLVEIIQKTKKKLCSEYLGISLGGRGESLITRRSLVGKVILTESDDLKRLYLPLAVIECMVEGCDGQVRMLQLRTSNGIFYHPIQRVYPLELQCYDKKAVSSSST